MPSPATSPTVNRADAHRSRADTDQQAVHCYRLVAGVENDPEAHHLAVYNGRMDSILEIDGTCFAFGVLDHPLGEHHNRKLAGHAVYHEFQRREAAPLAS